MGGKSAKRAANQAAEASRAEASNLREQTSILQRRTEEQSKKAQRLLMRSLRARGAGFFETDFADSALGGASSVPAPPMGASVPASAASGLGGRFSRAS